MTRILMLLAGSTALGAALAVPALGALGAPGDGAARPAIMRAGDGAQAAPLVLASDEGGDDDDRRWRGRAGGDDDGDDCDDDDDDDDGDCRGATGRPARNPAPAGTVVPPQNGLFGTGAAPRVQVN